jgi:hypothetical protein
MSLGIDGEDIALFLDVQAKLAVEMLRDRKIGHNEMEMIERVDPEFARSAARFDESLYLRHRLFS